MGEQSAYQIREGLNKDLDDIARKMRVAFEVGPVRIPPILHEEIKPPVVESRIVMRGGRQVRVRNDRKRDQLRPSWGWVESTENMPGGAR